MAITHLNDTEQARSQGDKPFPFRETPTRELVERLVACIDDDRPFEQSVVFELASRAMAAEQTNKPEERIENGQLIITI